MRGVLIGLILVTAWFIGMLAFAIESSNIPDECRADHPGPTPQHCFSDPPPWQSSGDAPERGQP